MKSLIRFLPSLFIFLILIKNDINTGGPSSWTAENHGLQNQGMEYIYIN